MAEGSSGNITAEVLDYMAKRVCPGDRVYFQLTYDIAMLSGIKSLLGSLQQLLAKVAASEGQGIICVTEEDLRAIDNLVGDIAGVVAHNMLKRDIDGTASTAQLNDKAVELANKIGELVPSLAYKMANCVSALAFKLNACEATSNEVRQILAQQAQVLQALQSKAQQSPMAPEAQKSQLANKPKQ